MRGNSLMTFAGLLRAWRDALTSLWHIFRTGDGNSVDAIFVYGGTAMPFFAPRFIKKLLRDSSTARKLLTEQECSLAKFLSSARLTRNIYDRHSLGEAYSEFVSRYGYDPDKDFHSLVNKGTQVDRKWFRGDVPFRIEGKRFFDQVAWQHDLMHVISGYESDPLGEAALHAFLVPQLPIPAPFLLMVALGLHSIPEHGVRHVLSVLWEAYRNGKSASQLFDVEWHYFLGAEMAVVRSAFFVKTPKKYLPPAKRNMAYV